MREDISEYLPETLPVNKSVLVLRPQMMYGESSFNSLVSELNRRGDWVVVGQGDVSDAIVTEKTAIVLTMAGTKMGAVSNVRRASKKLSITCPHQAFTISQIKRGLQALAELREEPKATQPVANGKGINLPELPAQFPPAEQIIAASAGSVPEPEAPSSTPAESLPVAVLAESSPPRKSSKTMVAEFRDLMGVVLEEVSQTLQQSLGKAQEDLASLEIEDDDAEGLHAELVVLRVELEAKNGEIHTRDLRLAGKDRETDIARAEVESKQGEIDRLTEELSQSRALARQHAVRISELERENGELKTQRDEIQASLDQLAGAFEMAQRLRKK